MKHFYLKKGLKCVGGVIDFIFMKRSMKTWMKFQTRRCWLQKSVLETFEEEFIFLFHNS
jgi:hypothetical protein